MIYCSLTIIIKHTPIYHRDNKTQSIIVNTLASRISQHHPPTNSSSLSSSASKSFTISTTTSPGHTHWCNNRFAGAYNTNIFQTIPTQHVVAISRTP
jgi:hypothetical protein